MDTFALITAAIVPAQAVSSPVPVKSAVEAQVTPLTLTACEVDSSGPNGRRAERNMSAKAGRVYISFTNSSSKTITQVHIAFYVDGTPAV